MRILAIADQEAPFLWDYFSPDRLEGVDLILSCGDLDARYLSFLATYTRAPVLYVHGNHDARYEKTPPEGCICIENRVYVHEGVRILGLGGSMRYKPGEHQYTQREMDWRALRALPQIVRRRGIDILLTHAPAFGLGDGEDPPHIGFRAFGRLLDWYAPACFVHGHVHLSYGGGAVREQLYRSTRVINAYDHYFFNL